MSRLPASCSGSARRVAEYAGADQQLQARWAHCKRPSATLSITGIRAAAKSVLRLAGAYPRPTGSAPGARQGVSLALIDRGWSDLEDRSAMERPSRPGKLAATHGLSLKTY